ncbi:MAG: tetratricopeptide repeat protein [bacterium]|nr:tetratricopeptide repeat protein [bacterium]
MLKRLTYILAAVCAAWLMATPVWAAKNEALNQAQQAAAHDEWEEAAALAQQAVDQEPKNENAWALLAQAQMELGDSAAAASGWETALGCNPRHAESVLALTEYYLGQDRTSEAERVVAAAEEKDKKGKIDEIKVARGMIYAHSGNMPEATKILASATAKNPKNPLYPQILAGIYANKQVYDLAEKHYSDAWALAPGNPSLAYEYGLVLQQQKKYKDALDLFKVVQEKDPNNKAVDFLIGRLYYGAGRYAEAARQLETAVEKRPDHFLSNLLLGRSYLELSKREKINVYGLAVDWLRRTLELRPDREDVKQLLADALTQEGRMFYLAGTTDSTDGAAAQLDSSIWVTKEALAVYPEQPGAYSQISRIFDKKNQLDSALAYAQLQYAQTPDDQREFARVVNLSQRLNRQGDLIALLAPVIQDTAMLARYGMILTNAQIETGNYGDARETIKKVIEHDPANCDAHSMHAYIDLKRERYTEAIPALRAGVRACPNDGGLWVYLGDCLYFSAPKDKETVQEAKEAYTRACAIGHRDGCEKKEQVTELLKTLR